MILISNSPHSNCITTYKDSENNNIIKSSYSEKGIDSLLREYAGYSWYLSRAGLTNTTRLNLYTNADESYCRLTVSIFSGTQGEHFQPLHTSREKLLIAIKNYAEIWPQDRTRLSPLHGDLSLGNMIFLDCKVVIIDWEHFQVDAAPWGFDLVNLLYESTLMSISKRGFLDEQDSMVFCEIREIISDLLNDGGGFKCCFGDLIDFYNSRHSLWKGAIGKFPVMNVSDIQRKRLLDLDFL